MPEALGRVLAEDVTAADPVPGFDNSAMDGYAVRAADTAGAEAESPARLAVVGESRAGHPGRARARGGRGDRDLDRRDGAGRRRRGGPRRGHRRRRDAVEVRVPVEPGNDIRRAGEDIAAGETRAAPPAPSSAPPSSACSPRSGAPRSPARAGRGHRAHDRRRAPGARAAAAPGRDPQLQRALARGRSSSARAPCCARPRSSPTTARRPRAALGRALAGELDGDLRRRLGRRARPRPPGAGRARRRAGLLGRRAAARASRPSLA